MKIKVTLGTMQNASKLVSIAESISCDVDLCYGRYIVDAKSMLGVLSLPDFAYGELQIPVETEEEKRWILEKLAEAGLLYEKKVKENRNGKPMKRKPKQREEKRKLNIKKRWDHLSSVNAKHWMSLLQNMLHFMEKKTGRFLHMKEMSLLSTTIFFQSLVMQSCQRSIPDSSKDIIRVF